MAKKSDSPYIQGIPRDKCINRIYVNTALIKTMIAKIPFKKYSEPKNQRIFNRNGGAEYCATVAAYLFKFYTFHDSYIPGVSDWKDYLMDFFPEDEADPVTKAVNRVYMTTEIPHRPDGTCLEWRDLAKIAIPFGYPSIGLLSASRFAYLPGRNKYVSLDGQFTEWSQKVLDEYVQPVLIDSREELYLDASTFIKTFCAIQGWVFDPALPSGLNQGYSVVDGMAVENAEFAECIYNLYRSPDVEPGDYDPNCPEKFVLPFVGHCRKMLKTDSDVNQLISWCAHIIQHPGEKVHWAPVLYSYDQGVGKDTILNFVQGIAGAQNCATIKASEIRSSFNEFAKSIMIRISELYDGSTRFNKKAFQEEVKALISGDSETITINQKYGAKITARNLAHVVITTNNPGDLLVSNQDRRYDIFECNSKNEMGLGNPKEYQKYFIDLHKWYDNGGKEYLYAYLLNYDLSNFDITLPRKTQAKVKMQFGNTDTYSWFLQVIDYVAERQPHMGTRAFRTDTIIAVAKTMAETSKTWDGPRSDAVTRFLKPAYRSFEYDFLRGVTKDGRWVFKSKPVSIIKQNNIDDFDPVKVAAFFAPPSIADVVSTWVPQTQNHPDTQIAEDVSQLDPNPAQLLVKLDQNQ